MNTFKNSSIIGASVRGFVCAGLATAITAFCSWTLVISTETTTWLGSDALKTETLASTFGSPAPPVA